MKFTLKSVLILLTACVLQHICLAQFNPLQKVDYSLIEGKILYVPTYESSSKYIDKMTKKEMYRKIADVPNKAEYYNRVWKEALEESGFEETDYKFTDIPSKELSKIQCKDCILIRYQRERVGENFVKDRENVTARLVVVHPKRQFIASANVTGLDLSDKNDIRLMLNILNSNLNASITRYKAGTLKYGKVLESARQHAANFVQNMSDKTFLIPKPDVSTKKGKKNLAKLEESVKDWTLSKTKLCSPVEIEELRGSGDDDSFYLKILPMYIDDFTALHMNMLISTADDTVLQAFIGEKKVNAKSLMKIQSLLKEHR